MSEMKSLLVEIGTEELPPKALPELGQAFFDGICAGLDKRGIAFERENARALYSPRRLAVLIAAVAVEQPVQKNDALGPYLNIGLNADGQPTPALLGFAAKNGLAVEQLQKITDAKGERFVARSEKPGASTASLLAEIVNEAVKALPIAKPMRWGSREISFVRPGLIAEATFAVSLISTKSTSRPLGRPKSISHCFTPQYASSGAMTWSPGFRTWNTAVVAAMPLANNMAAGPPSSAASSASGWSKEPARGLI